MTTGALLARIALVLLWGAAGLVTMFLAFGVLYSFAAPDCISDDPGGQRANQIGTALTFVAVLGVWVAALVPARANWTAGRRVAMAAALLVAIVGVIVAGGLATDWAVDRAVDGTNDPAMCF